MSEYMATGLVTRVSFFWAASSQNYGSAGSILKRGGQEQEDGSNELDSIVLANNDKPENQSGSENAIIITIEKYFKRFNYAIGIVMTKLA